MTIDRETGEIKIQKVLLIVEKVEDSAREISLDDAKKNDTKKINLILEIKYLKNYHKSILVVLLLKVQNKL